jgi:hypothetical protein
VAYSNTGHSDLCLQNYFRIVDSCQELEDPQACLSLGYLAHDLKYRDLSMAAELGELSIKWARSFDSGDVLPKNLCSYAESQALLGRISEAYNLFEEAALRCQQDRNQRELGRIQTNWGLVMSRRGDPAAVELLTSGSEASRRLGDRRRFFQGLLYQGVHATSHGDRMRGRALMLDAGEGFMGLDDGRYFAPALMWLLQLDRQDELELTEHYDQVRDDLAPLVAHINMRPRYDVYRSFWQRHLKEYLERP